MYTISLMSIKHRWKLAISKLHPHVLSGQWVNWPFTFSLSLPSLYPDFFPACPLIILTPPLPPTCPHFPFPPLSISSLPISPSLSISLSASALWHIPPLLPPRLAFLEPKALCQQWHWTTRPAAIPVSTGTLGSSDAVAYFFNAVLRHHVRQCLGRPVNAGLHCSRKLGGPIQTIWTSH